MTNAEFPDYSQSPIIFDYSVDGETVHRLRLMGRGAAEGTYVVIDVDEPEFEQFEISEAELGLTPDQGAPLL